ncbi:hypothetical protein SAMN00120144_1290 [Hymenobacter roseosalivarius DSM 11622]|uniref:Knr4/Smi1-like domain-containing protein n=1 Tax=Hymenobacter roseosalivarius DSM 11622 TaxID=645990 RepID=A0A1W1W4L5_9BACT|nr:SMI1/KNR4 family protein [Hymenobacter roseosalivarius]SMC00536.1 hypothetical protein SAMN00120144_1290 [Hymenobacter roseosalivarius DSM 11622]
MKGIIYTGAALTDKELLITLPQELQAFLRQHNGVVAYFGGLHIRGCCAEPAWHSLRAVWHGEQALYKTYDTVLTTDIPFAQDCVGNQFLLRQGEVVFLDTETGEIAPLEVDFKHFLIGAEKYPVDALELEPLRRWQQQGGTLTPGQLLHVYPPVCIAAATDKATLAPVAGPKRLAFLAGLYQQIKHLPDGQALTIKPLQD